MSESLRVISFDSFATFHEEVSRGDVVVDFGTEQDEKDYGRLDAELADQIYALLQLRFGEASENKLFYLNWDWFPNKGRSFMLNVSVFTLPLVRELAALLRGTYRDWRMFVTVCKDFDLPDHGHIGDACILHDQLLVMQCLVPFLRDA